MGSSGCRNEEAELGGKKMQRLHEQLCMGRMEGQDKYPSSGQPYPREIFTSQYLNRPKATAAAAFHPINLWQEKSYLEDWPQSSDSHLYYAQSQYDDRRLYERPSDMRSPSAPPQHHTGQRRALVSVEPEEMMDEPREPRGGSRVDMVLNTLAPQAISTWGSDTGKRDVHRVGG